MSGVPKADWVVGVDIGGTNLNVGVVPLAGGLPITFRTEPTEPQRGAKTFQPINTNGSQRGGRPIVCYLPSRIGPAKVLEGPDLNPVVTDDFLLIPNPKTCDPGRTYQVKFQAKRVK